MRSGTFPPGTRNKEFSGLNAPHVESRFTKCGALIMNLWRTHLHVFCIELKKGNLSTLMDEAPLERREGSSGAFTRCARLDVLS